MATAQKKRPAVEYRCAACGRKLKSEQWVYSQHSGNRYCLPDKRKGCNR